MSRTYRQEKRQRNPRARFAPSPAQVARLDAQRARARNWLARSGIKSLDTREDWSDAFTGAAS